MKNGTQGSPLVSHAKREISLAQLDQNDSDYGGMLGKATLELVECLSKQQHSGASHGIVLALFNKLANYEPLTPLTDNPDEWEDVSENMLDTSQRLSGLRVWQNKRSPSAFSKDGGKTYRDTRVQEYEIKTQPQETIYGIVTDKAKGNQQKKSENPGRTENGPRSDEARPLDNPSKSIS